MLVLVDRWLCWWSPVALHDLLAHAAALHHEVLVRARVDVAIAVIALGLDQLTQKFPRGRFAVLLNFRPQLGEAIVEERLFDGPGEESALLLARWIVAAVERLLVVGAVLHRHLDPGHSFAVTARHVPVDQLGSVGEHPILQTPIDQLLVRNLHLRRHHLEVVRAGPHRWCPHRWGSRGAAA